MGDEREEFQQHSANQRSSAKHVDADGEHDQKRSRAASKASLLRLDSAPAPVPLSPAKAATAADDASVQAVDADVEVICKEIFDFSRDIQKPDQPVYIIQDKIDALSHQIDGLVSLLGRMRGGSVTRDAITRVNGAYSVLLGPMMKQLNAMNAANPWQRIDASMLHNSVMHMAMNLGLQSEGAAGPQLTADDKVEGKKSLSTYQSEMVIAELDALLMSVRSVKAGSVSDSVLARENALELHRLKNPKQKALSDGKNQAKLKEIRATVMQMLQDEAFALVQSNLEPVLSVINTL